MKVVYKYIIVFALALGFMGCEDFIGGDINADPNNPTSVPITAQMPAFQIALADVYGGDFSRICSMLSQQVEGVERQWNSFNQYTGLTPNRFDDAWQNIYENVLNEVKIAQNSATEEGLNHHKGILDIIEAFTLLAATDVWDDIPYSEALQGISNINPKYDTQEEIYSIVTSLLDNGRETLNSEPGPLKPGGEDVYYGGDIDRWIKAANAIKARALLHTDDYSGALAAAQASFESTGDNMAFQHPDANAAGNWYRFNRDRTGDIEFHPTLRSIMTNLNDTDRLAQWDYPFIIAATGEPGHPYMVPNFLQELITYRETQFIIAECASRNNDAATAHKAYLKGIEASFARTGASGYADYIAQSDVDPGEGNLTLEHIMTQKYIAMFLQPETYSDYRRTNIPDLQPVSGTNVPVRWEYSADEYLFNSNLDEGSVDFYTDKVWWNR